MQSTPREWFFQLQRSFQLLEALGSSRIADSKNNEASVQWAQFVLQGLFNELQKTEKLTDINYVRDFILEPVLQDALRKGVIAKDTYSALLIALRFLPESMMNNSA